MYINVVINQVMVVVVLLRGGDVDWWWLKTYNWNLTKFAITNRIAIALPTAPSPRKPTTLYYAEIQFHLKKINMRNIFINLIYDSATYYVHHLQQNGQYKYFMLIHVYKCTHNGIWIQMRWGAGMWRWMNLNHRIT